MAELDFSYEAARSLKRIRPKIHRRIAESKGSEFSDALLVEIIETRLDDHWERFFRLFHRLYGSHYDFFYYLESIALTAVECWLNRPDELHRLDERRVNDPGWYLSERMVGGSLYVDLFCGDLRKLRKRIPYLKDLGLTYLHLMPVFAVRPGENDGGYAISDYRSIDPRIGTIEDLSALAGDLRKAGISLVLDFVFNHTSDDHVWAIRAQEGEREFMDYYYAFPDRAMPDRYEQNLREIFPTVRRGNFTWHEGMKRWVWTTFNSYQWDLNYSNPEVFRAMASEMLFLANTGVEGLRLDAVAFIWKRLGTGCENLPEAHLLIKAFNILCRIAAPSLIFKSEAIVHPDEVIRYISHDECQLSYNPNLMALLWESIATRETHLLKQSIHYRQSLPTGTTWTNYLRCHDDIGWAFDDGDAWAAGIHPQHHREFLNRFYTGRFAGSFARGVPFQHNEDTGDMRISGTMASLAGLEQALEREDEALVEMALRRIRLLYGVLSSVSGMPLVFLGEEWGILNDYAYLNDPGKAEDSRWIHRMTMVWDKHKELKRKKTPQARIFREIREIFHLRASITALGGNNMKLLPVANRRVLGFLRWHAASTLAVIANFSETPQNIELDMLRENGLAHFMRDAFTGDTISTHGLLRMDPYSLFWLEED